jgi:hypothetical protein
MAAIPADATPVGKNTESEQPISYTLRPNTAAYLDHELRETGVRLNQLSVIANDYREKITASKTPTKKAYYRKKLEKVVREIINGLGRREAIKNHVESK